jgi:hypothetical protein
MSEEAVDTLVIDDHQATDEVVDEVVEEVV